MEDNILKKILFHDNGDNVENNINSFFTRIHQILNKNIQMTHNLFKITKLISKRETINIDKMNSFKCVVYSLTNIEYSKNIIIFLYYLLITIKSTEINYLYKNITDFFID